ncbi:MAG: four helix bundle protein [Sphingobacteriales bacterium]|nr:four helix bundle protein [Sphingobacteriales bacterium]MBI3718047.1 four helix bundle protein [Sphingobacteriales bacterium]
MGKSILKDKSFAFAKSVVSLYQLLVTERKEFVMSKQLLRSGTSVGAMIREAQNAESKMDFVHKLSIAQKECDEACYWLELLFETGYLEQHLTHEISGKADEIIRMIKSAILTTKSNLTNKE